MTSLPTATCLPHFHLDLGSLQQAVVLPAYTAGWSSIPRVKRVAKVWCELVDSSPSIRKARCLGLRIGERTTFIQQGEQLQVINELFGSPIATVSIHPLALASSKDEQMQSFPWRFLECCGIELERLVAALPRDGKVRQMCNTEPPVCVTDLRLLDRLRGWSAAQCCVYGKRGITFSHLAEIYSEFDDSSPLGRGNNPLVPREKLVGFLMRQTSPSRRATETK